jgi:phosphatidylethanolamine/phosphatidyl-N-methylethanolamine N-methyltransferase
MQDTARTAAIYDRFMSLIDPLLVRRWRRILFSQVRGPRVLEAGVGTGLNIAYYRADWRVTALDRGAHFLARARRRARSRPVEVEFVRGDVQELPFPAAAFDCAVAAFLFCSVQRPEEGLRELHRVLRPGGLLLLLEHCRAAGGLGRVMDRLANPFYRLSGDSIARDTAALVHRAGFRSVAARPLLRDVVKIIRAVK